MDKLDFDFTNFSKINYLECPPMDHIDKVAYHLNKMISPEQIMELNRLSKEVREMCETHFRPLVNEFIILLKEYAESNSLDADFESSWIGIRGAPIYMLEGASKTRIWVPLKILEVSDEERREWIAEKMTG